MAHLFSTPTRSLDDLAAAYVASRGKASFLSVTLAVRAVRTLMPTCEATDEELADIIASAAIEQGTPVAFDFDVSPDKSGIAKVAPYSS